MEFKKLLRLLSITKSELWIVVIYGVAVGLLSLVVPIAAQGLVTIVSFGSLRQPLFILGLTVFILLAIAAVIRILQHVLIETFQQRIFAATALNVAQRLPRLHLKTLDSNHGTELLNRFFDVVTIQKTVADLLLSFSGILLQSVLGMILLAAYHPFLLLFDIIFIISLIIVIVLPYRAALKTALMESDAKYEVVGWLDELVRVPLVFKFQDHSEFAIDRTDQIVSSYVRARKSHFRRLLQHICGTYFIQVIASTSLLVLGGLLVLNDQMTLGQLVAAEIIVTALGTSVTKIGRYLEKIYDLFIASEKVDFILDLPLEVDKKLDAPNYLIGKSFEAAPSVSVNSLVLFKSSNKDQVITFEVKPKSRAIIMGNNRTGKSRLVEVMLGLRKASSGVVEYNGVPLDNYALQEFRKKVSFIKGADCFDGSIIDNLVVGNKEVDINLVNKLLKEFKLDIVVSQLKDKLNSELSGLRQPFTSIELIKLMFVRSLLARPHLLIVDDSFDMLSEEDINLFFRLVDELNPSLTVIATSRHHDIEKHFNQKIIL